jgi:hypothetical protein
MNAPSISSTKYRQSTRGGNGAWGFDRHGQAFIYDRAIDGVTYRAQRDKVRQDIAVARMEASAATQFESELESMLAFTDHALHQASTIWTGAASTDERIRFQWAMFPTGVKWSPLVGNFERPISCLEFFELENFQANGAEMVDLPRPTWKQVAAWLTHIHQSAA